MTLSRQIADMIWPRRSLISGTYIAGPGLMTPDEWSDLTFISDPICEQCGRPMEIDLGAGNTCGACIAHSPVYDAARAPLIYNETASRLVLGFKRGGRREGLKLFANWMRGAAGDLLDTTDYILPVPLHYRRLAQRGFNQAGWLAQSLSRSTGIPTRVDGLQRTRATPIQGHMSASARRRNVSGAFRVNPRHAKTFRNRRIALIDDVLTTGATVNACARVLKKSGVSYVGVVTLARVVRDIDVTI